MNAWSEPPRRHHGRILPARPEAQKPDAPLGAIAAACFLLAIILIAIFVPDLV
jgi:hypothetical protein